MILSGLSDNPLGLFIYPTRTYIPATMKALLTRIGSWIVMHPRAVSVIAFAGLTIAAAFVLPALGIARPRWKP